MQLASAIGGDTHPSLERNLDPALIGNESQRSGNGILVTIVSGICLYPKCLPSELFKCQNLPRGRKRGRQQENAENFTNFKTLKIDTLHGSGT